MGEGAYEAWVVVGCPGGFHVAQRDTLHPGEEAAFANQPVGVLGRLVLVLLLDHDAEGVGDVLVEGARFVAVDEGCVVLDDGVLCL